MMKVYLLKCILLGTLVVFVLSMMGCNECVNPSATTNCVTACANAGNRLVACGSCCNSKPSQTPAQRDACKAACEEQYVPQLTADNEEVDINPLLEPGQRSEVMSISVQSPTQSQTSEISDTTPCRCERIAPCDAAILDPIFSQLPTFWRTNAIGDFICSLTAEERVQLLADVMEMHNSIFEITEEDFNVYMQDLNGTVVEIMQNNEVEGDAHYVFYRNNLLYGLWGYYGFVGEVITDIGNPVPNPGHE
ncbi:MAG: hypothetical protein HRU71_05455 [Planctomycetia bacterium]|nr:MAG: hypothetical protein HRU71_05455 [Planctomycetia bacterium]